MEFRSVPDAVTKDFVLIRSGRFIMGSPTSEQGRYMDEGPQHEVAISKGVCVCRYAVTQKEWRDVMGGEHHSFFDNGDESILPVEYVSWFDAVSYCNKRSIMDGLKPAYTINGETVTWNKSVRAYRLLTEAEWEFACRGGTKTPFNVGDNIVSGAQANYNGTVPYAGYRESSYWEKTWSVRIGTPNDNGLYNMHGNVCEWCWDLYGAYSAEDQVDPCGPEEGDNRVARGGCWYDGAAQCRSASRRFYEPYGQIGYIGFRVAFGGL